jgi:hypothetical protein
MLFTPIESWRVFEIVHFLIFLKQVFSGISQCAKNRRKIIVYGVKSAENWLHNKIFISYRKLVPTCVRLDCLPGSLTTWLESWDANADLERVTDLASFANLLRPPRNRSERKFKILLYIILYISFILYILYIPKLAETAEEQVWNKGFEARGQCEDLKNIFA